MGRIATITAFTLLLGGPSLAAGETPFEKVKGWEIERTAPGSKGPACLMSKSYKDPDDDNAENALIFALAGNQAIVSFVYEHWTWSKDEKLQVPLVLDKKVAIAKSAWTGDGQTLTALLPDSIVPNLLAAKTLVLKLDGADADFKLGGFPEAYESLRRCDSAPAQTAAAAAAAPPAAAVAAASSTDSAHIEKAMTFPGEGNVPPQTAFARTTPKILLALAVRAVKSGDSLTTAWIAEKTDGVPPNFTISSVQIPLGASPTVSSSLSKPDAGWPPGQYRVDVSHNGGPVEFSQRFTVQP
ncbi:hypothetical protein [Methylobacterium brachythecii]|uniref:Uncharacterized protein n=1 Tax=Methylobacterium brachythecii TaxID=1176177 RepID=A0A7W6F6P6_9HYPH|nr:hypothetical protein [Methylobacterium brachythecii]MBB3902256.1 hypothetical protein [Methylobacterium brachythecii]GLS42102.1 hypothetical protein GCM10007884_00870 [Methylobacterium brachythecii]